MNVNNRLHLHIRTIANIQNETLFFFEYFHKLLIKCLIYFWLELALVACNVDA